jgi:hypothetical protein
MATVQDTRDGRQGPVDGPDPRGDSLRDAAAQAAHELSATTDQDADEAVPKAGPDHSGQVAVGNTGGAPGGQTEYSHGAVGGPGTVGGTVGGTTTGEVGAVNATNQASDVTARHARNND